MKQSRWKVANPTKKQEEVVKKVRYTLSVIFAIIGLVLLGSQLLPLLRSYGEGMVLGKKDELRKKPVDEKYLAQILEDQIYDPGQSYFQNYLEQSGLVYQQGKTTYDVDSGSMQKVNIDENYSKPMKLSIASIGIKQVNVSSNVNSYEERVYDEALKHGLAHFKGTPLPGDGGNSFIYGHSTVQNFFNSNPDNPEIVFSRLEKAEIGDTVIIEKDNKSLEYIIRKRKKVEPEDFSVLESFGGKETVTLMTCWPLGVGTDRLIVVAERRL